jgi:hypothetical protein
VVPVAKAWAARLTSVADVIGGGLLCGAADSSVGNPVGAVSQRARRAGLPVLSLRRMRATWLLGRLNDGVPVDVLMPYAALQSAHALDRLMPYVVPRQAEVGLAQMRGDLKR